MGESVRVDKISFISIFGIALVGGFGHCIGMCGGIVLAYCGKLGASFQNNKIHLLFYHLLYNLGRISTYIVLGVIVGILGSMFVMDGFLRGCLFVFAGIAMVLAGLSLFGKIKFLTYLEHSLQNTQWYQKSFRKFLDIKNPWSLYLLGVLNGLLPCGFVYAFLFAAAGFANPLIGGAVMAVFGLGTIPALVLVALLANTLFSKQLFRKIAMNLATLAIIVFGVLMIQKGIKFLQNPEMGGKMHMQISIEQGNEN